MSRWVQCAGCNVKEEFGAKEPKIRQTTFSVEGWPGETEVQEDLCPRCRKRIREEFYGVVDEHDMPVLESLRRIG